MNQLEFKSHFHEEVDIAFNGLVVGTVHNDLELLDIQIQIAEQQLEGYGAKWKGHDITINSKGELSEWPRGMYDHYQTGFSRLIKARKGSLMSKYAGKSINNKYYGEVKINVGNAPELTEQEFKDGKQGIIWVDNKTGKPNFKKKG